MARIIGFAGGAFIFGPDDAEPPADTTPDPYDTFTDQFNVPTGSVRTSNAVTPTGFDAAAPISVSGADTEYDLDSAEAWTSSPGTINPGQSVRLRHTADVSASTTVTSTVDIGGVTATFESTTAGAGGTASLAPVVSIVDRRRRLLFS